MAKMFCNYPELSDDVIEENEKSEIKKIRKKVKKLKKKMKKQKKEMELYKRRRELQSCENIQNVEEDKTTEKKEKSFLNRVSDAFFKVLPGIFSTAASVAITSIFGRVFKKSRRLGIV